MTEVTRYNFELYHCNGGEMEVSPEGDFVDYDDYAAIKAERDALLAENSLMLKLLTDISEDYQEVQSESEDMCAIIDLDYISEVNTYVSRDVGGDNPFSATDALLNEVRAEGIDICISAADTCMSAGEYWPPLGSMREIARSLRAETDTTSSQYESRAGGK